jgi:hypothetical protein
MHRRIPVLFLASLLAVSALAGCGQKAEQTADTAVSDSLLAASPIETPAGDLQPDTAFTPQPEAEQPPAPTPSPTPAAKPKPKPGTPAPSAPTVTVPAGTALKVAIDQQLSSETAQEGDTWTGKITEPVVIGQAAPFPAGSVVHGVIAGVKPAEKGDRAFLLLKVTSIEAEGKTITIGAAGDSMIAGSTRKRNLGAIAGGAAAGALIGKAVGGSNKGAVVGGILGGAAATGAVAGSKGFQVIVKEGAEATFRVNSDTKVKL